MLFYITIFAYVVIGAIRAGGNPIGGILVTFGAPLFILAGIIIEDNTKPQNMDYMTLIKLKNRIGGIVSKKLLMYQQGIIPILGVISVIFHFTLFKDNSPWLDVHGYLIFTLLWMASVAVIGMYYYSWSYLKKLAVNEKM